MKLVLLCLLFDYGSSAPPLQRDKDQDVVYTVVEKPKNSNVEKAINRPDHLDGVPLERDGELNKEFRQEVLLGGEVDVHDKWQVRKAIENMFKRADKDENKFLSRKELEDEVEHNLDAHLKESREEALSEFKLVDEDGDGQISWPEYKQRFLAHEKMDVDDNGQLVEKEDVLKLKDEEESFRGSDSDNNVMLNEVEWTGFLHPEHSVSTLRQLADDIVNAYDTDNDGKITMTEFTAKSDAAIEGPYAEKDDTVQRQEEFKRDIDVNGDGVATIEEVVAYVDPGNPARYKKEVSEIIDLCDMNADGQLTLDELLANDFLLESSALLSAKRRLHDDL